MNELAMRITREFIIDSAAAQCEEYGCGHINKTYLVVTESSRRYILQRINTDIFPNVEELMRNIDLVTGFLRRQEEPGHVLTIVPTVDSKLFYRHEDGSCWRMYDFVEDSVCLQASETKMDFYQSAIAFGNFQQHLADFPAETLFETIPNFHNTVSRYQAFEEVLKRDSLGRAKDVAREVDFALARREEASCLISQQKNGLLPLRVTHNDTKLNNVLLDAQTHAPLCVIDLDTVMPGLSLYDFGDSIRFGAATAEEDCRDLDRMEMNLEMFEIFTDGYLKAAPDLTVQEREMLPMGAKIMTLECGLRFLTDYLDGDHYFAVHRDGQNLDRCRTQFKLVADMEKKWTQMAETVRRIGCRYSRS